MKIFKNAQMRNSAGLSDILVNNGKIERIAPSGVIRTQGQNIDLQGRLVSEPFIESHIHLDFVYTAITPEKETKSGTLFDAIDRWSQAKDNLSKDEIKERAMRGIQTEMRNGVQYIRTHVDVTDPNLTALQALLELKEETKDKLYMQIIAFPQEGYYAYDGGADLVEEALKMGADVVGGIPHFEFTRELGEKSVKKAFELAVKYDKLVDIHCDETDDPNSRFVENIAAEAYYTGIGKRATASHTCAMGSYSNAYAFKMISKFKKAGINFVSCPTENCCLQGRFDGYPRRRGLTRTDQLIKAGVNVSFAQDSISDYWYPLGNGNLINQVDFGLHLSQMMSIDEISHGLDFITKNAAKTLNIEDNYGIAEGRPADFIVIDAKNEFEAIRERASVLMSIRNGKTIMERTPVEFKIDI